MKIKFLPQNIEVDLNPNKSVLNIALENGIHIHSICKGIPSCAECRVKIVEGENYINKPSKAELNLIGNSYYLDGRRLSCQVRCFGPVTIDTTEQVNRQDNPAKKIRGFKSEKQYESHAILDTMILNEPTPAADASAEPSKRQESSNEGSRDQNRGQQQRESRQNENREPRNRDQRHQQGKQGGGQNRDQRGHQNQGKQGGQNRGPDNREARNRDQQPRQQNQGKQGGQGNRPQPQNRGPQNQQQPQQQTDQKKKTE